MFLRKSQVVYIFNLFSFSFSTAASVAHVQNAIEHIFPLVYEFRKKRSPEELEQLRLKQMQNATFEDIEEVEKVLLDDDFPGITKRKSNTLSKFPNAKRKRSAFGGSGGGDGDDDEFEADDPDEEEALIGNASAAAAGIDDDDDMVMYDPNESIIAGPEDDDDDL